MLDDMLHVCMCYDDKEDTENTHNNKKNRLPEQRSFLYVRLGDKGTALRRRIKGARGSEL